MAHRFQRRRLVQDLPADDRLPGGTGRRRLRWSGVSQTRKRRVGGGAERAAARASRPAADHARAALPLRPRTLRGSGIPGSSAFGPEARPDHAQALGVRGGGAMAGRSGSSRFHSAR
jgi:hypothetical protein